MVISNYFVIWRSIRSLSLFPIITETQPYDACGRDGGSGTRKQGHAVNTSLYARRQPGPGQPLDRFPVSPSPCCRRSLFRRPHTRCQRCTWLRTRAARPSAAGTMHRDVRVSCEGRMPVATAAVEPTGRYLRRVLQPGAGCRVPPSWLSFSDNQVIIC
jgi:hypothetical protein